MTRTGISEQQQVPTSGLPRRSVLFCAAALVGALLGAVARAENPSDVEIIVALVLFLTTLAYLLWHLWALQRRG